MQRRRRRRDAATGFLIRLFHLFFGRPLASGEAEQQKVGAMQGVPILGLDALGSASYGPEAALAIFIPLGALALAYERAVIWSILILLALLYFSYRQTIDAYPNGGGAYSVAKANLGRRASLFAAAALLLDYILNVAVGISAGVGALESALPSLQPWRETLCLAVLGLVVVMNLRGVREAGLAWSLPTAGFVLGLLTILGLGTYKAIIAHGNPVPAVAPAPLHAPVAAVSAWLIARAFASGCTAMTGVEAVSNGVPIFAEPATKRARGTLTIICATLGLLLLGIGYLTGIYHIGALSQEQPGYESVVSQLAAAIVGRGWLYYSTIACVLAVLVLSANTSFSGFPRLCSVLARDRFLPPSFGHVGRRLVYTTGIVILAILSGLLLLIFHGVTDRLIPLFAVGAFGAFTMSQAGMVRHWWREHHGRWSLSLVINGLGALATTAALIVIVAAKFTEGAWASLLLMAILFYVFLGVHRHYTRIYRLVTRTPELRCTKPRPPLVIIPIESWNRIAERAVRFAMRVSEEITAVHVSSDEDDVRALREIWTRHVEEPARAADLPVPRLEVVDSPYRELLQPLLDFVDEQAERHAERTIAVVIPELVQPRWWEYLLHNSSAAGLKAALLFLRDDRVVVINTPWYSHED